MKKGLACFTILMLLLMNVFVVMAGNTAATFIEDFSGDFSKLTNGHLDNDPNTPDDKECIDVAKIENGALHINNKPIGGSFFYIAPKDIKAKNFTVSAKVKALSLDDSWVGFSIRKDVNDRFNGCNNVLITFRLTPDGAVFDANRGYPGGSGVIGLKKKISNPAVFTGNLKEFHTYKIVAKDNLFSAFIDDQPVGVLNYDKLMDAGYISLNACVVDIIVDDFTVVVEDGPAGTPAPADTKTPAEEKTPTPAANNTPKPTDEKTTEPKTETGAPVANTSGNGDTGGKDTAANPNTQENNSETDTGTPTDTPATGTEGSKPTEPDTKNTDTTVKENTTNTDAAADVDATAQEKAPVPVAGIVAGVIIVAAGAGAGIYFKFFRK